MFDRFDTDFDDFGWTAGVNWQFLESMGVFARYTSTFRLPSVGDYITNAFATPVTRTMDFIEAGYKYQGDLWSLYATVFQTNYDSFRFGDRRFNSVTGNYDEVNVFTDTETLGVELEGTINARASGWTSVSARPGRTRSLAISCRRSWWAIRCRPSISPAIDCCACRR